MTNFKLAFAMHKRFWVVLAKHLTRILELDYENRQLEDGQMMERIIVLIRNVLHIPSPSSVVAAGDEVSYQDRLVQHMADSGLMDILHYMIDSGEYGEYCFHLIEIIYLMMREQDAQFLVHSVESDRKCPNNLSKFPSKIQSIFIEINLFFL